MGRNLLQNDGRDIYLNFKKRKESFSYHFRSDLVVLVMTLITRNLSFDDGFMCSGGQHPRLLRLLIQKERLSRPSLCLTTFCRLVKIEIIKKLPKKLSILI